MTSVAFKIGKLPPTVLRGDSVGIYQPKWFAIEDASKKATIVHCSFARATAKGAQTAPNLFWPKICPNLFKNEAIRRSLEKFHKNNFI